jgi:GT2 family glycosyltransferase
VIVPAYNAAATLAEQLEALAAQRFDGDWELVIVDNGPPVPRIWRGAIGSASRSPH